MSGGQKRAPGVGAQGAADEKTELYGSKVSCAGSEVKQSCNAASDTPELRRYFGGEPTNLGDVAVLPVSSFAELVMNTVNQEAKVPVQPMYLPFAFKGATESPVIYSKTDGKDFKPSALEGVEELRPATAGAHEEAERANIENLRAPVDDPGGRGAGK
jgi:hypothetical protein